MLKKQFKKLQPCREGLEWALAQPSLEIAWETCHRSDWMWWLLRKLDKTPKELSINYAQWCAKEAQQYKNTYDAAQAAHAAAYAAQATHAAYATAAAAAYAHDASANAAAAYAAACADDATDAAAASAAVAAAYAAYATDTDTAKNKQANYLRSIVSNPFKS